MMPPLVSAVLRGALFAGGLLAVGVGGLAFRPSPVPIAAKASSTVPHANHDSMAPGARPTSLGALVAHDAFRRNRLAPSKSYDGVQLEAARLAPAPVPAAKPLLVLSGILWGVMPAALVDGVPGSEGSHLFHPGDTAGGIRLRSLTRDHVVLAGMDTTWTLVIRRPAP